MCVCVLSPVLIFALEQWNLGVSVCVCVHAHTQLCPTLCGETVAYGCVRVLVCVCSVLSDSLHQSEQWRMGVCVCELSCV